MAFVIDTARPENLAELTSVIFRAHKGEDHYINCAFPDNLSAEGQARALEKLQSAASAGEEAHWIKVTDTSTGNIVGVAIWKTFLTRKPASAESSGSPSHDSGKTSRDEEYVGELNASIGKVEAGFWKDNALPLISLFALAVAPEYQRKGIGTMLIKEGYERADRIGATISVVSTDAAGRFYIKSGFRVEKHVALEVSEKFSMEEKVWIYFLIRDRVQES